MAKQNDTVKPASDEAIRGKAVSAPETRRSAIKKSYIDIFPKIKNWGALLSVALVSLLSVLCFVSVTATGFDANVGAIRLIGDQLNVITFIVLVIQDMAGGMMTTAAMMQSVIILFAAFFTLIASVTFLILGIKEFITIKQKGSSEIIMKIALVNLFANVFAVLLLVIFGTFSVNAGGVAIGIGYVPSAGIITALVIGGIFAVYVFISEYIIGRNERHVKNNLCSLLKTVAVFVLGIIMLWISGVFNAASLLMNAQTIDEAALIIAIIASVFYILVVICALLLTLYNAVSLDSRKFNAKLSLTGLVVTLCLTVVTYIIINVLESMYTNIMLLTNGLGVLVALMVLALIGLGVNIAVNFPKLCNVPSETKPAARPRKKKEEEIVE